MCHQPASASAGIAADDAQAGSGMGTAARACVGFRRNPDDASGGSSDACGVKDFGAFRPRQQCVAQQSCEWRRQVEPAIGVLDVVQQHWVAQQDRGQQDAPAIAADRAAGVGGGRGGSASGRRGGGAACRPPRAAGEEAVEQRAAIFAGQRRDRRMRPAASSSRARKAARCSGVVSPPASRSRSNSASASGRGGVQHRLERLAAPAGGPACPDPRRPAALASRSVRSGASSGRASSAARAAARAPAASPSKQRTGVGDEAPKLVELLLGQRRAERRDRAGEARPGAGRSRPCSPRPPPPPRPPRTASRARIEA